MLQIPDVYEQLANILSAEVLSTLDPLLDALEKATARPTEDIPMFRIALRTRPGEQSPDRELRSDNGLFHVSVEKGWKVPISLQFWVSGIGRQVRVSWDSGGQCTEYVALQEVPQSQLLRSQMMRDTAVQMQLFVTGDAKFDADSLVDHLIQLPEIKRKVAKFSDKRSVRAKESDEGEPETKAKSAVADVSAREIWSSLLKAEEESFPTVFIAGETKINRSQPSQTLVPYHADGSVIDYDNSDTVLVESQSKDGDWHTCGTLNLRDTTYGQLAELAVDRLDSRANTRIGAPLRLMSILERGSLSRRRLAVERILEDKSIVPSLIDYFDPTENAQLLPNRYSSPADEDLAQYSDGDKVLNESQKEAFHRVLSNGPVSLLQGPPGTGKTWFIACLLHYLMTKVGARRILLASQSHEAVNNALEKSLELCKEKGVPFHAVRLGNASATSEEIRH